MSNKKRKSDELSKIIEDIKNINANDLIDLKNNKKRMMYDFERRIKKIKQDIDEIDKEIYKKCEHNWERDYSYAGPYTKPEIVCTKCNLFKSYHYYFSR